MSSDLSRVSLKYHRDIMQSVFTGTSCHGERGKRILQCSCEEGYMHRFFTQFRTQLEPLDALMHMSPYASNGSIHSCVRSWVKKSVLLDFLM